MDAKGWMDRSNRLAKVVGVHPRRIGSCRRHVDVPIFTVATPLQPPTGVSKQGPDTPTRLPQLPRRAAHPREDARTPGRPRTHLNHPGSGQTLAANQIDHAGSIWLVQTSIRGHLDPLPGCGTITTDPLVVDDQTTTTQIVPQPSKWGSYKVAAPP
jgi:hypothetical protein